ncbi:hypothetical protein [Nocardioides sp. SR21]|uniref:hypothetical protein n=1 Tax=Nocardioides sp. SR21 TaxID=2919501 RepID=UPI001FA955BA|nr:hypothetical protein [Nocardioides sp. SR21]
MNTIDDLRSTLDRHTDALDDTERLVRADAVRSRVRTVRRRRAAAVAVAAVVVLVVATATVGLVRGGESPQPAGLGDVDVPAEVSVHGFGYRLADTVRASADGTIDLDESRGPRAVTLVATGLGSGQATLWSGYWPIARVRGGEQISPVTTDVLTDLRVEFEDAPAAARAELAVYSPDGDLPPGVAHDGVVFRQQWGDQELVAAAFGEAGGEATAEAPDLTRDMDVSPFCRSETSDLWLHTEGTNGGMPCADFDQGSDPGPANQDWLGSPDPERPDYSVYVTQGRNGPRADGVDVTFGFGIYRQGVPTTEVLGADHPTVLEAVGRTWQLDEVLDREAGEDFSVDTSQGDVYIGVAYADILSMTIGWRGAPEEGWGGTPPQDEPQGPGGMYMGVLLAGEDTVEVDVTGPDAQTRLLVYRPVSQ